MKGELFSLMIALAFCGGFIFLIVLQFPGLFTAVVGTLAVLAAGQWAVEKWTLEREIRRFSRELQDQ